MKKILSLGIVFILLFPLTVYANSAPSYWMGNDGYNAVILTENCPITVEKEILTFNISEFPNQFNENNQYGRSFTAEYTLYNPTDKDITAQVLFPFGKKAEYIQDISANESYNVQTDGKDVSKEIRYTFSKGSFDIDTEIQKISDEFYGDGFFLFDQTVTRYTIQCGEDLTDTELYFEWENKDNTTCIYSEDFRKVDVDDSTATMTAEAYKDVVYYLIGDNTNRPQVSFVIEGSDKAVDTMYSPQQLTTPCEMTLKEFILTDIYPEMAQMDITETDLNNIVWENIYLRMEDTIERAYIEPLDYYNIPHSLMGWFSYEITIPAKATVTNTVTAPVYPDVNEKYNPTIYTYSYLLSPAGKWADFKNLEIYINTPYYITDSSIDGFEKTNMGYTIKFDTMPKNELEFTLCASEKAEKESNGNFLPVLIGIFSIPIIIVFALIVIIVKLIKKRR